MFTILLGWCQLIPMALMNYMNEKKGAKNKNKSYQGDKVTSLATFCFNVVKHYHVSYLLLCNNNVGIP